MKKYLYIVGIFILLGLFAFYSRHPLKTSVLLRDVTFYADVAVTNAEKQKGLGGRQSLASNSGMLFPYDHEEQYSYWMKDMQFPIDILWIRGKTIMDITKNVPVYPQTQVYSPSVPVNLVLELNAGTVDKIGAQIGDTIIIKN